MKATITGIVLAGGQSTRMGTDKGLLLLNGKPMIEYPVALLKECCQSILISCNTQNYNLLGVPTIPDMHASIGPIGGLYSCLLASTSEHNVFLACDMPLVDMEIIQKLLQHKENYEIIVPSVNNWPIPVCGYYNKAILPLLETEISKGNYSLQSILNKTKTLIIEMDNKKDLLRNINTQEEFQQLIKDTTTLS